MVNRMSLLESAKAFALDVAKSLLIVVVVSAALYTYAGVWPPLVVVESGSMEPNMHRGDIVLVKSVDGPHSGAFDTNREGVEEHFGKPGDVVVYDVPNGGRRTPIIHRAMYWVNEGDSMGNGLQASNPGYVTKGDNNVASDQASDIVSGPVRPEWIRAKAVFRVPLVGYVRLFLGEALHL